MKELTVLTISYRTPDMIEILIKSFEKFKPPDLKINYVVIENSEKKYFENSETLTYINNPTSKLGSYGNSIGIEIGKKNINTEWTFVCHSDVCVTNETFFSELEEKINEGFQLVGHRYDIHPERMKAYHVSGLLINTKLLQSLDSKPMLPKMDVGDIYTKHCQENNIKHFVFTNTLSDKKLFEKINEPFKSLGPSGVDRTIDKNNNVKFLHLGRGTPKFHKSYSKAGHFNFNNWKEFCEKIINE